MRCGFDEMGIVWWSRASALGAHVLVFVYPCYIEDAVRGLLDRAYVLISDYPCYNTARGSLAQLAEQGTFNPKAQGSNP